MTVTNERGEEFELTPDEEKFLKALKRLSKLNQGNLKLFGSGLLDVRYGGCSSYRSVLTTKIECEGGDGGDDFD